METLIEDILAKNLEEKFKHALAVLATLV